MAGVIGGKAVSEVKLPFGWKSRSIFAGPYYHKPDEMLGVKMAKEIDKPYFISVPTRDFSVPPEHLLEEGVGHALLALAKGKKLYVGCMGGVGRTGLFLAILVKALGVENPVEWVRKNYNPHAVETRDQYAYVQSFDVGRLQLTAQKAKMISALNFWR